MQPTSRQTAVTLPAVDDTGAPLSSLFGFDLATVEATAQLADRSIFVSSTGRRFLFETIPGDEPPQPAAPRGLGSNPHQQDFRALNGASIRRRPLANTRTATYSIENHEIEAHEPNSGFIAAPPYSPTVREPPSPVQERNANPVPKAPTQDVTTMLRHLDINRFGATALYGESDGGAQAAETLTDPGVRSIDIPMHATWAPTTPQMTSAAMSYEDPGLSQSHGFSNLIHGFNYGEYMAQANIQAQASRTTRLGTSLPSLMEFSSPLEIAQGIEPVLYSPMAPQSPQEYPDRRGSENSYFAPTVEQIPVATVGVAGWRDREESYNGFDTTTPIVVLPPQSPSSSSRSDGASMGRDNVLPGEDILFDGPVANAKTLSSPVFESAVLKVFRNTLNTDLRFHCRVGPNSETFWMKGANAQLVPVYAYDQRFPMVVYIRDNDRSHKHAANQMSLPGGRQNGIYRFDSLKQLFDFQATLTGEKVVLDIASVRLVKLVKANSRSSDTFSSVRLQIWHEDQNRKKTQSDVASFVTAGTALSGPMRERLIPNTSRLMIYLGRLSEHITVLITDDIEVRAEGSTMVKLKARKGGSFSKKGSRWPGVRAHLEPKHSLEPAGLDIHGKVTDADVDSSYDLYKTFEIEFENSPSQDNFLRKWDEVIQERRLQRKKLDRIQEEMEQMTFSGRKAREIW